MPKSSRVESFAAFSDCPQNAFKTAQGIPKEVRTGSLSEAYRNQLDSADFNS